MSRNAVAFEVEWGSPREREPGAYCFLMDGEGKERIAIIHACPCGCGSRSVMHFCGKGGGSTEWDIEGTWPKVTAKPSIGIKYDGQGNRSQYHWHGYLTNGVFEEI